MTDSQKQVRLHALYDMAVELSGLRSLDSVLNTALNHCLTLTESEFGFIGLNSADGKWMDVVAIHGFHPVMGFYEQHHRFPVRHNIFARAVLENRPVRSDDAATDPHRVGQPHGHPPVRTFLGVPLRVRNNPIGMIGLANRATVYQDDHEQLLMTYAAQVAIVMRNVQLYEELTAANARLEQQVAVRSQELHEAKEALAVKADLLQRLLTETIAVQERERQRIAHGMHDGINQLLIGAMLELKAARQRMSANDLKQAEKSLDSVKTILHRTDAELRRIIHDLRPPTLDALGLVPALRRYATQFQQYSTIPCSVQVVGTPIRLSPVAEISLYRLTQEALNNVNNHSHATQSELTICFNPDTLQLVVADNGCGFDLATAQQSESDHLGLVGMRERAESLGGSLAIQSTPGAGTRLELTVPVPQQGIA
jgi:signal transduction histidine kinase